MSIKHMLQYGLLMGGLFFLLETVQYRVWLREIPLEIFGLILSVLFLALGIWIGMILYQRKALKGSHANNKLGISERELEVLQLMAQGFSNQEIADKLFVSLNTIKTHISNIYLKLNAKRRTQAIEKARELAILTTTNE